MTAVPVHTPYDGSSKPFSIGLKQLDLNEWIEVGVRAGRVRADVDTATQAALFVSAIRGAAWQWLIDPSVDVDAIHEEIKATFARNLGGSEG